MISARREIWVWRNVSRRRRGKRTSAERDPAVDETIGVVGLLVVGLLVFATKNCCQICFELQQQLVLHSTES